jgi:hypothetical protein
MKTLTQLEKLGYSGENVLFAILKHVFTTKDGYRVIHCGKEAYLTNIDNEEKRSSDFRVYKNNKWLYDIEVKNWRYFSKPYGSEICQKRITPRFVHSGAMFKVLIITYLSLLTSAYKASLKGLHIHAFETSKLLGKSIFKSPYFFKLANQLKSFLNCLTKASPFLKHIKHKCLLDYSSSSVNTLNDNTINDNTIHDTPLDKILSFLNEVRRNYEIAKPIKYNARPIMSMSNRMEKMFSVIQSIISPLCSIIS